MTARALVMRAACAAMCAMLLGTAVGAQDTTSKWVKILGIYAPGGERPGVLVLPIMGRNGDSLRAILQRDLEYGDRVRVLTLAAADVPPPNPDGKLNYPLLARLGAKAVIQVGTTVAGVRIAIHTTARGQVERVADFPLPSDASTPAWRMAVHDVSDQVEFAVTGTRGIATTRILYVSGGRLWQIDSDGANPVALTGAISALFPAWHPRASHVAYTVLTDAGAQLQLREAGGATRNVNLTPGGTTFGAAFSPDGRSVVYAHGREDGVQLYTVPIFGSEPPRRITVGRFDNTAPTFSHDGRKIAFTTNRLGPLDVYISDADGTNAEALFPYSGADRSYRSDPDWSPDGLLIAYQTQIAGNFQIAIARVRDRQTRTVTGDGRNENPSWAPDSRHLVFTSSRGGSKQLWIMDTETSTTRQLTRAPAGARLAAWSPPLKP